MLADSAIPGQNVPSQFGLGHRGTTEAFHPVLSSGSFPVGVAASKLWSNPAPPLVVLIDDRSFRFNGLCELDLSFSAGFYLPKALLAQPLHQSTDSSQ